MPNLSLNDILMLRRPDLKNVESVSAGAFYNEGLPFICGCQICEATLAPYNAYPSKSGFVRCASCIANYGFATLEEFETFCERRDE